jgi:type II secretion system protein H
MGFGRWVLGIRESEGGAQCARQLPRPQNPTPKTQAGYTLLEALLALAVIGAASALVVANMPPPEPTLAAEARTLAARLTLAGEEAVVSGLAIGVDVDEAGYRFRRRVAGAWRAIEREPGLEPRAWPAGVSVETQREGAPVRRGRLAGLPRDETAPATPVGRFDPTGAATALTFELRDDAHAYRIAVDPAGAVTLVPLAGGA